MKAICLALIAQFAVACYTNQYPVTPTVAEASTYKMIAGDYSGTAWSVADHYLVTAGHMCEAAAPPYVMISSTGRRLTAEPVEWVMPHVLPDGREDWTDVCLVHTASHIAPGMVIAREMPAVGTKVHYVGYPLGEYRQGDGVYLGDVDGADEDDNDYVSSTPSDHGASGSAMFSSAGVFGVLVRIRTDNGYLHDGSDGAAATPLAEIVKLLDENGVDYDVGPDPADIAQ